MIDFNINYDEENDDLFVYLGGAKSEGAIEAGNLIFDFDKDRNLVAMEVIDASKVFAALLSKAIQLNKVREFKAEATKFRNIESIKFTIADDSHRETASVLIPQIIGQSPALNY